MMYLNFEQRMPLKMYTYTCVCMYIKVIKENCAVYFVIVVVVIFVDYNMNMIIIN